MAIIDLPQTEMTALIVVYSAWETVKAIGVPDMLRGFFMSKKSVLTSSERKLLESQQTQCRDCNALNQNLLEAVNRQTEVLNKIHETMIEVRVKTDLHRR